MADEKEIEKDIKPQRARNRTVMLTPEITGEVRARLAKDGSLGEGEPSSVEQSGMPSGIRTSSKRQGQQMPPQPAAAMTAGTAAAQTGEGVYWAKESKIVGFLVSYDSNENGSFYELRVGRLIVSSEPAGAGSCLVIEDETVSPMHAIIRIGNDGTIQVLDQLSEFGTVIKKADTGEDIELSGDKAQVSHGDVITFGQRNFYVCLVPLNDK